ncbi:MAG: transcription antitermination factor NusG [Salibacteraceae bacterium]|jgi:transcription antitermination factor NusG
MKDWQAVYVKPRTEKKVMERLQKYYTVFCPIKTEKKKWSDRVKMVETPLLPGYVFFQGSELDRLAILEDSQVVRSVFWNKKPAIIYGHEIEVLRSLLSEYTEFETKAISAGENVKIITGAFAEKEGTLIKFAGNTARVELKTLGISILATVAVDNIKRK